MSNRQKAERRGCPDFFTLGLLPPCTTEDVKQAYLEKVKAAHPDAGGHVADFLKLQKAFERATDICGVSRESS